MRVYNRLGTFSGVLALMLASSLALPAKSKKGDKLLEEGRRAEQLKDWDKALDLYEKALQIDPSNSFYDIAVRRTRFQATQKHVDAGKKLREQGKLEEALAEYNRAYAIDPGSAIAEQEIRRTNQMIEREKRKKEDGTGSPPEAKVLTPNEEARKEMEARIASVLPVPELKPISPQITSLKMNNQPVRVLFETVGKLAGVNVVFDPDYQAASKNFNIDLTNTTLDDALDNLGVLTKSFWKPLSSNTIFVTNDNPTKRRDYEDNVVKVFYLSNVVKPQDLQEILTAVRTISDIRRIFPMQAQNAILVRGTTDQVALAEKLINDIDKPRSEVVVDVVVMEANIAKTRTISAGILASGNSGLSLPFGFSPRSILGGTSNTTGSDTAATTTTSIPITSLPKVNLNDWQVVLPNATLQALMTDRDTRVLQSPQVRAVDGEKAALRIGDRYPYATGSFQPGVGAVGVSPLVSTQFQFADVGVNVDLTPRIHGPNEVTLHAELEISSIKDTVNLGGLSQPIIGQRKLTVDIRVKDGEATLVGGLTQVQDTRSTNGTPGLASIPLLGHLFKSEDVQKNRGELVIALVPHIVRSPEITPLNTRGIAAGNDQQVKLNFAPRKAETPVAPEPKPAAPPAGTAPTPAPAAATVPTPEAPAAPAQTGPSLVFVPSAPQTQTGQNVQVTLQMNNINEVFSASLRLKFDPKMVKVTDVKLGPFLSSDGQRVTFSENTLNDTGEAIINLNRYPGAGGLSGSGGLLTFTLQPQAAGTAQVTVTDLMVRSAQLQPIALTAPSMAITVK